MSAGPHSVSPEETRNEPRLPPARPIICVGHPRSCSSAFEKVFHHHPEVQECFFEPIGDAFFFGPEALNTRSFDTYPPQEDYADCSFAGVMTKLEKAQAEARSAGKTIFIKEMGKQLMPINDLPASIAASFKETDPTLQEEPGNPTVIPEDFLKRFHFTFLIRHPALSVPSLYAVTLPPQNKTTNYSNFCPNDLGYHELRRLFDYLVQQKHIGPGVARRDGGSPLPKDVSEANITVVETSEMLDDPEHVVAAYCREVGLHYEPSILDWEPDEQPSGTGVYHTEAYGGWFDNVSSSTGLRRRAKQTRTREEEDAAWTKQFGEEGQKLVRRLVDENMSDYEYLSSFAL